MRMVRLFLLAFTIMSIGTLPAQAENTSMVAKNTASIARNTVTLAQDTAITTYIYAKLATKVELAQSSIDISTTEGKVTLNGIVNSDKQAREIAHIAENTAGVRSVDASKIIVAQQSNNLYLKPIVHHETPVKPQTTTALISEDTIAAAPEIIAAAKHEAMPILKKMTTAMRSTQKSRVTQKHLHHKVHAKKIQHTTKPAQKKTHHAVKHHKKRILAKKSQKPLKQHPPKHIQALKSDKKQHLQTKKPLPTQAKRKAANIKEMTSDFLKAALMTNKSVVDG